MKDRVTLGAPADDYGRRCRSIGLERRNVADLQDAMNHPAFKAEHHALLDYLAREYRASIPLLERPPRYTSKLGIWKTKAAMVNSVKAAGYRISDWAESVIRNEDFILISEPGEYEFFETSVRGLTGHNLVKTPELYASQERLGYCVAPCESACAIRLALIDRRQRDWWCYILSKPVADDNGLLSVLCVGNRSGEPLVHGNYAGPYQEWSGDWQLLVCRKK